MNFSLFAYAKLNLKFDRDAFIKEYDELILPRSVHNTSSSYHSLINTVELNKSWGMVHPDDYLTCNYFKQSGDADTTEFYTEGRPVWKMFQMMELDDERVTDPLILKYAKIGGPGLRNESLKYNFKLKKGLENSIIYNWIISNIPLTKINSIHCVSLPKDSFSSIHRDAKPLYDNRSSAGVNKLYNEGFVVINLNISDGGVPLYWALDGEDVRNCFKVSEDVYLTNDYFLHGVPICLSRRRQIRITGIPSNDLENIIDMSSVISLDKNYQFDTVKTRYPG